MDPAQLARFGTAVGRPIQRLHLRWLRDPNPDSPPTAGHRRRQAPARPDDEIFHTTSPQLPLHGLSKRRRSSRRRTPLAGRTVTGWPSVPEPVVGAWMGGDALVSPPLYDHRKAAGGVPVPGPVRPLPQAQGHRPHQTRATAPPGLAPGARNSAASSAPAPAPSTASRPRSATGGRPPPATSRRTAMGHPDGAHTHGG